MLWNENIRKTQLWFTEDKNRFFICLRFSYIYSFIQVTPDVKFNYQSYEQIQKMRRDPQISKQDYARQSEYFIKKYGIGSTKPTSPLLNYERTCNLAGYGKVRKRIEMESTIFTGINEVMKVPTTPNTGVRQTPETKPLNNENRPMVNIPKHQSGPRIVKIRLRLKTSEVDQAHLQQLTDKLTFKQLPKGFTLVQALVDQGSVKMFQTIFKGSNVLMEIIPVM